ncbi:hypothetical protein B0H14DRAFT_3645801 [Mycena olivaceomarginata]|nr:hypothetical protein B0H14DRAFT_3645801 [Mycena olivaceomarginata]
MSHFLPPLDCSTNLPEIINLHIAHENYSAAYAFAGADDGPITEISRFEFARAAHRVAHLLRPGRSGADGQVVAIVAHADVLVYQTIVAGCLIAGLIPFQIFHRTSTPAIIHLLRTAGAHRLLTTKLSLGSVVDTLSAELSAADLPYDLSIDEIPLLGQLYPHLGEETSRDPFVPYPSPTVRTPLDDVVMYLHSSGSTGLPKCIPETHRTLIHFATLGSLSEIAALSPRQAVGTLPPGHGFGMVIQLLALVIHGAGTGCIYPPASTATEYALPPTPTAANALAAARRARATGMMCVPSLLVDWYAAAEQEDIAYLKTLNLVAFGGGPLATKVGDALLSWGVNIFPMYGGTEFGLPSMMTQRPAKPASGDWAWFAFTLRANIRWEPQGEGTFECQFLTVPETHQLAVENLPDVKGYSTKDLVGRLDDVLTLANGEKAVPGPMEDIMDASPYIACAIMFGRERNQVGVLVEPTEQPVIEAANENAPAFSRIYKEMVLLTHPERPMVRTHKGTVTKKSTLTLYEREIEELYAAVDAGDVASNVEPPMSWASKDLEPWLRTHASQIAERDIDGRRDLFDQGFDSLNTIFLRHLIAGSIEEFFGQRLSGRTEVRLQRWCTANMNGSDTRKTVVMEEMVAKYSEGFEEVVNFHGKKRSTGAVVLLTGSTGGLGSHILDLLLSLPSVERVYAFNRRGRIAVSERQSEAFVDRDLDLQLLSSDKLVYLEGDALRDTITVIIHNAWSLDFNKALSSFEPHVKGTRNLIDLARQSATESGVRFLFTVVRWRSLGLESQASSMPAFAIGSGYGESKYISERILAASGLDATSFRIGQICGSTKNGGWSTTDWVPAIVKSSIALGNFPSDPSGVVSWLPPEAVSRVIVDAALSADKPPPTANIVHPRPISWDVVMSTMASAVQLPLIPFADWVQQIEVRSTRATAEDIANIPGIKLLDF